MDKIKDYKKVVKNIREELKNYLEENKLNTLVIGVSGGIDSALCLLLARPICDKLNINIIGRVISIDSNKNEEIERAINIGTKLCDDFEFVNMDQEFDELKSTMKDPFCLVKKEKYNLETQEKLKIRLGNIKARLRMIYLYNIAQYTKGMVLSTDNLTEYLLGFWTICGDVGDYGMIQNLWKTEVYEMTEYLSKEEYPTLIKYLNDIIYADATDGLGITSTDLDQILPDWKERHDSTKKGYEEVDEILQQWIDEDNEKLKDNPVIKRHLNSEFKRNLPVNILREKII